MMQFTGLEKVVGLVVLIMIIIMVTGCQSRYYPPAPKYEGYVLSPAGLMNVVKQ